MRAAAAAYEIGFPVVVKALGIAHKTDVGGVRLNLRSGEAVEDAVTAMSHLSGRFMVENDPSAIVELDVNPLLLLDEGQVVVAADALISMRVDGEAGP